MSQLGTFIYVITHLSIILNDFHAFKSRKFMMKFLVGLCEQRPMLRDGTVLRSSAVIIGTTLACGNKWIHVIGKYKSV